MKKLLKLVLALALFIPFTASAANIAAPWFATSTTPGFIAPTPINGNTFPIIVPFINTTSVTASSTFANGINITKGCFALNGVCFTGSGGTNYFSNSGANTTLNTGTNLQAPTFTATNISGTSIFGNLNVQGQNLQSGGIFDNIDASGSRFIDIGDYLAAGAGNVFEVDALQGNFYTNFGNFGISSTTPGSLLSLGSTNGINFTLATSTFNSTGGINLNSGCFSIKGTCVTGGGGGGSGTVTTITAGTNVTLSSGSTCTTTCTISVAGGTGTVNSGTANQFGYYSSSGTTISGNSNFTSNPSGGVILSSGCLKIGSVCGTIKNITGGDQLNDFKNTTPDSANQLGIDGSQSFASMFYTTSGTTGAWVRPFIFPTNVEQFGVDPSTSDAGTGEQNMRFNFNDSYGTRNAAGDSGLISVNWSQSPFNSGSGFCNEITDILNGTTTAIGSGNSSCFLNVPDYAVLSDAAGNSGLIFNGDPNHNKGLGIYSPTLGGTLNLDSWDYNLGYFDLQTASFRVPYQRLDIGDPYQKQVIFTVSGVTTVPTASSAAFYTTGGKTYQISTTNISGGSGTLVFIGTSTPVLSSGTITKILGTGDATISYSAVILGSNNWLDALNVNTKTGVTTTGTTTITGVLTNSSTATSTFAAGINLTGGCIALNGNCVGGTGGGSPSNASGTLQYNRNGVFGGANNFSTDGTNPIISADTGTTSGTLFFGNVKALYGSNTIGSYYLFNAGNLGTSTVATGGTNIGIGPTALQDTLIGNTDIAIGSQSQQQNASSSGNVSIGVASLRNFNDGTGNGNNTAIGNNACIGAVGFRGDQNDCIGKSSGPVIRGGSVNNFMGSNSAPSLRDGQRNEFFGTGSGVNVQDANDTVFFGDSTGFTSTALQNNGQFAGAIGSNATVGCSNCFVIGTAGGSGYMNLGIGTTTPYAPLSVVGKGGVVAETFNATSTTATSTFASNVNITSGCYAVNGSCIPTQSSASTTIEVFLIGGQSNAVGQGTASLSPTPAPRTVLQFSTTTNAITAGNDPVGSASTGSAWPSFGIAYYNATGRKVLFIPAAVNGSSQVAAANTGTGTWDTSGTLYGISTASVPKAMAAASALGYNPVFGGILWDQGETDADAIGSSIITQAQYTSALTTMIANYRTVLGPATPFYIYRIGTHPGFSDTGYAQIRAAEDQVSQASPYNHEIFINSVDFPSRGLQQSFAGGGDPYHYLQEGYNEMGVIGAANVLSNGGSNFFQRFSSTTNNVYFSNGQVAIGTTTVNSGSLTTTYPLNVVQNSNQQADIAITNLTSGTTAQAGVVINSDGGNIGAIGQNSTGYSAQNNLLPSQFYIYGGGSNGLGFFTANTTAPIIFSTGGSFIEKARFDSNGNLGIGSSTPGSILALGSTNGINLSLATSTFNSIGGINLIKGCFAINGVCQSSGGGSGITALTGDVTASGSGSVAATLATVNSNVGSFTNANITVNAKGLITAASNGTAGSGSYPFTLTGNATSTLTQFNGGLTAFASSTIGNGSVTGGLTVNGTASTSNIITTSTTATSTFAGDITQGNPANGTALVVDYTGNVGVGTSTPWRTFSVNGTVAMKGLNTSGGDCVTINATTKEVEDAGGITCSTSSKYTKHDIAPIPDDEVIKIIDAVQPIMFTYNQDDTEHFGFIAEEVDALATSLNIPDIKRLVEYAHDDVPEIQPDGTTHVIKKGEPYAIDYNGFVALDTRYIQIKAEGTAPSKANEIPWVVLGVLGLGLIITFNYKKK